MHSKYARFNTVCQENNFQIEQIYIYTSQKVTDIFETQNQEDLRKALYYLHCNEGKLQRLTSKQKKLKEYIDCIVKIIGDSETSVEASLHTGIQTAQKEH